MIDPFPEPHELISLFESEPTLVDPDHGYGWAYNSVIFTTVKSDDRLRCEIWGSGGHIQLDWERAGDKLVTLDIWGVTGLRVEVERGSETLVAQFDEKSIVDDLRVRISPSIAVWWGTSEVLG